MSNIETNQQEAAVAIESDAPIDVDDLPSDAEASTSALPTKTAGSGRPKGKSTVSSSKGKEPADAVGLEALLLPKSTITKIAKSAVPPNTKLQKEIPTALTRSAVVFISYLTSLAQEQAAAAGVKTIRPDHVLEALPELDWGEADTARLRKDLKKQLKAFRANAKAKKEGKPVPGPSTTGKPRGRPPKKAAATDAEVVETDGQDEPDNAEEVPEVNIQLKRNVLLQKSVPGEEEESSEDEEDDVNVRRLRGDEEEAGEESAIEDDIEEEEEEEEDDDDDEDGIEEEEDMDPNDFEEEMGQGLDDRKGNGADDEMED